MLESIYVGMTGLLGYSRGLRVIANNTANINTPGFKSSSLQFADMFYTSGNLAGGNASQNHDQVGFGLNTTGTAMSFKQGELRQTGNDLDMAVDGQGLFVLQDAEGKTTYTRAGQFKFDENGVLVSRGNGEKVMAMDESGNFIEIGLAGQMQNQGKPTTRIKFSGNISSTAQTQSVDALTVIDGTGATHTLSLKLTRVANTSGTLNYELLEGTTVVASGQMFFAQNKPTPESTLVPISYTPAGLPAMMLTLDFSTDVSFLAGATTDPKTLTIASQDGVGPGTLSGTAIDGNGVLRLSYTNGQTIKGARLALARFDSPDAVGAVGNNQFEILNKNAWHFGKAGEGAFGTVRAGQIEISNVDLSQEFSDLVIMQRGYQASSQVISTANDMLQELFSMKSK